MHLRRSPRAPSPTFCSDARYQALCTKREPKFAVRIGPAQQLPNFDAFWERTLEIQVGAMCGRGGLREC